MSSWIKGLAENCAIGRFGVLFLYLEMPEQIGRTQGAGVYCIIVCRWILYTWSDEIPLIPEVAVGFSVANSGGGAKNVVFGQRFNDLCPK
jgi:hypothetical protein